MHIELGTITFTIVRATTGFYNVTKYRQHPMRSKAFKFAFMQLLIVLLATAIGLYWSNVIAVSIILGGISSLLPNLAFISIYFTKSGAPAAKTVMRNLYLGQAAKVILTIALLITVLATIKVWVPVFIVSFIFTTQLTWLAPWLVGINVTKRSLA